MLAFSTYKDATAISPSDSAGLVVEASALYVGVSGDLTVDFAGVLPSTPGATQVLLKAVPVGILPVGVVKVWATGTGASDIVALR
jgi:hypothetical protein